MLNVSEASLGRHATAVLLWATLGLPAFAAADCAVKDVDISRTYLGGCQDGLADGKGVASGRDRYEGSFLQGQKHGSGKYTWADGTVFEGEYSYDKRSFGELRVRKDQLRRLPPDLANRRGRWDGDFYVIKGQYANGRFLVECDAPSECGGKQAPNATTSTVAPQTRAPGESLADLQKRERLIGKLEATIGPEGANEYALALKLLSAGSRVVDLSKAPQFGKHIIRGQLLAKLFWYDNNVANQPVDRRPSFLPKRTPKPRPIFEKEWTEILCEGSNPSNILREEAQGLEISLPDASLQAAVTGACAAQLSSQVVPQPAASPPASTAGERLRDCDGCPEVVMLPPGSYQAGEVPVGTPGPNGRTIYLNMNMNRFLHQPRTIAFVKPFGFGKTEVTVAEFRKFSLATGYTTTAEALVDGKPQGCLSWLDADGKYAYRSENNWRDPGFPQSDDHPVVCVSWLDAQAYVAWLRQITGKLYRLPSAAEWRYAALAGDSLVKSAEGGSGSQCRTSNQLDQSRSPAGRTLAGPNYSPQDCSDGFFFTAPVASFAPNAFGLYDMIGNASEWMQDCELAGGLFSFDVGAGAPVAVAGCSTRPYLGGSWASGTEQARVSYHTTNPPVFRQSGVGFRVALTLR